ncbi:amidohydrolase family protein [Paenibacillus cymbidii]|uniref:hypothetical protein n=1 Tax=Paenibacillus cymbidii TaxID=1639034 RepID=UPI0010817F7E|nr:hypothetical protein [Paenibacillus cymbidii]
MKKSVKWYAGAVLALALALPVTVFASGGAGSPSPSPSPAPEAGTKVLGAPSGDEQAMLLKKLEAARAEGLTEEQLDSIKRKLEMAASGQLVIKRPGVGPNLKPALDLLDLDKQAYGKLFEEGKSLAEMAADKGVSREQLKAALSADMEAQADALVAAGSLTAEQAAQDKANSLRKLDALLDEKLQDNREGGKQAVPSPEEQKARIEKKLNAARAEGLSDEDLDNLKRKMAMADSGSGLQAAKRPSVGPNLKAAFDLLGLDKPTYAKLYEEGKSLAEIAADKGVTREQLKEALSADLDVQVNKLTAGGILTTEQAAQDKANALLELDGILDGKITDKEHVFVK